MLNDQLNIKWWISVINDEFQYEMINQIINLNVEWLISIWNDELKWLIEFD